MNNSKRNSRYNFLEDGVLNSILKGFDSFKDRVDKKILKRLLNAIFNPSIRNTDSVSSNLVALIIGDGPSNELEDISFICPFGGAANDYFVELFKGIGR